MTSEKRPTIAELEAIMADASKGVVEILPDGSIVVNDELTRLRVSLAAKEAECAALRERVNNLKAAAHADFEIFHAYRMRLTEACGDPYKLHDEALEAIIAQRDAAQAENQSLRQRVEDLTAKLHAVDCAVDGYVDGAPDAPTISRLANEVSLIINRLSPALSATVAAGKAEKT